PPWHRSHIATGRRAGRGHRPQGAGRPTVGSDRRPSPEPRSRGGTMRLAPGPLSAIDQNLALLAQGLALCRRIAVGDYAPQPGDGPGASIGPQLRHCIEAYRSFLDGLPEGRVDYD